MDYEVIFADYCQVIDGIFHYQNQQIELKIIILKIMLGTFAIIGVLAFSNIGLTNYWFLLICSVLPLLSLIIITVGVFHDLIYKEQLKLGFFYEAIKLEKEHFWLPEFHKSLVIETKGTINGKKSISFYFWCACILICLSATSLFLMPNFSTLLCRLNIIIIFTSFCAIYSYIINCCVKRGYALLKFNCDDDNRKLTLQRDDELLALLHAKGRELIEHFSNIKMRYKNLAVTAITAIFIAFAYIIGSQESFFFSDKLQKTFIHENQICIMCFIALLAVTGVNLIRFLDINLSHESIRKLFLIEIALEKESLQLAKPYTIIANTVYKNIFDPILIDFLFYSVFNLGIIIFGTIMLLAQIKTYHSNIGISIVLGIILMLLIWEIVSFIKMYRKKLTVFLEV